MGYERDSDYGTTRAARDRIYHDATSGRDGRRGLAVITLLVSVFLLVGAVSARQVTAPGPARDILESGIAVTTEIDRVIAEDHEALKELVRASSANTFAIPDYPLDVVLTRDEILNSSDAELERLVLERSSGLVYGSGLEAFDRTGDQSFGRFSSQGLLELAVGQISESNHDRANLLSLAFMLAVAATGCFVLLTGHGWGRLKGLGLGVLGGALPGLLLFGFAWFMVGAIGGSDPFVEELRDITRTTLSAPLRNYIVTLILGVALLALGIVFGMLDSRVASHGYAEPDEDY